MRSITLAPAKEGRGYAPTMTEMPEPVPGRGEMTVSMGASGLCGTDLEKIRGEYTASKPVIGHEAVGVVRDADGATGFERGDRVFPHHHVPDYDCYLCRAGNETMCDRYRSSNLVPGGFAETFLVPRWNVEKGGVLRLPDDMSFEVASLIEPLACCIRAVKKSGIGVGESVLIAGAGPVGMMHALLLKAVGTKTVISDVSPERLAFAERAGAGVVVDAMRDVAGAVRGETAGRGADVAIVASGSKAAVIQGLKSIRKGGKVVLFGVPARDSVLDYDVSELYNAEQGVVTSYGATEADAKAAVNVLKSRGSEFGGLVTHRFPLSRFEDALQAAAGARAMKVVLTP